MSLAFTAHVLGLPYNEYVRHWVGLRPWTFDGKNVRYNDKEPFRLFDVTVSTEGAVTRVARPIERPCFGSPTAFLIHGGDQVVRGRGGHFRPNRCHRERCPFAAACALVARHRLIATPAIRAAWDTFEAAGGRQAREQAMRNKGGIALQAWHRLVRQIEDHGTFPCINAEKQRGAVVTILSEQKAKDAARKSRERARERAARLLVGEDDERFLQQLLLEANLRALEFDVARSEPGASPRLTRCDSDGGQFTAKVWRAKMLVDARGLKGTPGRVTKQLIADGVVSPRSENAQRNGAVASALARVEHLEMRADQGSNWRRVTVQQLLEEAEAPPAKSHARSTRI